MIKIAFQSDGENDQLYIALGEHPLDAAMVAKTLRVTDDIWLDFDAEGKLVGIVLLSRSRTIRE